MFSPEVSVRNVSGASTRNPRRRQRHDSDSIKQQPVRKRSKLSEHTFSSIEGKKNGNGHLEANGRPEPQQRRSSSSHTHQLTVREKKKDRRSAKEDGTTLLTKTSAYLVKQLPAVPEKLRSNGTDYRSFTLPYSSHALAFTREHALLWDYTSSVTSPIPRIITLPFTLKSTDPLPVGALVTNGPSSELGLVVIAPLTGKVMFWDNVDSAESSSIFQKGRQGVEGSAGSMLSGESIVDIIDAEHAGFILRFSTGRIAHLTLRDTQGRPAIAVQFLRNAPASAGGFFGNLRSFVPGGSAFRRDVVAVKTRPSEQKGQMDVIAVTETGTLQMWDVDWAGRNEYRGEIMARDELVGTIRNNAELQGDASVKIIDFEILPEVSAQGNELDLVGSSKPIEVLLLAAYTSTTTLHFSLVRLCLVGESALFTGIFHLSSYGPPLDYELARKARLLLPRPGHSAVAVFQDAVVIASLSLPQDSPDNQLFSDTGRTIRPFQDVIYFKQDKVANIAGIGLEDPHSKSRASNVVVFTSPANILRFTIEASPDANKAPQLVTAKSKIEQAVFFGSINNGTNVLDLHRRSDTQFSIEDVQLAAIQVSLDILNSSTDNLPHGTLSMDYQLARRSQALKDLVLYIRSHYRAVDKRTLWTLIWHAEKLAAARALWKCYEDQLKERAKSDSSPAIEDLISRIHVKHKNAARAQVKDLDSVRQWFVKDVGRIDQLVLFASLRTKEIKEHGEKSDVDLLQFLAEVDDVLIAILKTAFDFRSDNADLYGLLSEDINNGILENLDDYRDLPEIWTSSHNTVVSTKYITQIGRKLAEALADYRPTEKQLAVPALVEKLALDNADLVKLVCQTHMERYRYCLAQEDEKTQSTGRDLKDDFDNRVRREFVTGLAKLGQADKGMTIAEGLKDMDALAELVRDDLSFCNESLAAKHSSENDHEKVRLRLKYITHNIRDYFRRFGDDWGNAFFDNYKNNHMYASLFQEAVFDQERFTKWLRGDPHAARICWINDVTSEKDFAHASQALTDAATKTETNSWCKGVELSIAKLSLLAAKEHSADDTAEPNGNATAPEPSSANLAFSEKQIADEMRLLDIQKQLYNHLRPVFTSALDDASAIPLAMETFGKLGVADRHALSGLLSNSFEALQKHNVLGAETLIEMLTLMDHVPSESPDDDISGKEFWLALQALDASGIPTTDEAHSQLLRLIWKRAFVRDDWEAVNDTTRRSDRDMDKVLEKTALGSLLREGERARLWNTTPTYTLLAPSDALRAGSTPQFYSARFHNDDKVSVPLAKDNATDDNVLSQALKKYRLAEWWTSAKKVVKESVEKEIEDKVASEAEEARTIERIRTEALPDSGAAGVSFGFEVDDEGREVVQSIEEDGDGDVEMTDD